MEISVSRDTFLKKLLLSKGYKKISISLDALGRKKQVFVLRPVFAFSSLAILAGIILVLIIFLKRDTSLSDEIILSELEHHANLVPWQQAAETHGLVLKFTQFRETGEIDFNQ